jgi:hypothetical protein
VVQKHQNESWDISKTGKKNIQTKSRNAYDSQTSTFSKDVFPNKSKSDPAIHTPPTPPTKEKRIYISNQQELNLLLIVEHHPNYQTTPV